MKIDGRYLKDLREKHKLSLREFAKRVYASKSSVQRWEQSSPPEDDALLQRIAAVYNTTAEEIERASEAKYGKDSISPEKLAELKFGVKWLTIPLAILPLTMIAGIIITLIISIST